jgi:20S proteasome alpha/beta subunit
MTILTGIICPDAIVLAADSQMTEAGLGTIGFKDKISIVHFANDEQALIASAGAPSITDYIVELVQQKARGVKITNPRTVTDIIENAIGEYKAPLDDDQKEYGKEHGGELILAFYASGKPYLYTIAVYGGSGKAATAGCHYVAAGVGKWTADYLLREFAVPGAKAQAAIGTSIYVIRKVKRHQAAYCGGDTIVKWLGIVAARDKSQGNIGRTRTAKQEAVNQTEASLDDLDLKTREEQNKQMMTIIQDVGRRVLKEQ